MKSKKELIQNLESLEKQLTEKINQYSKAVKEYIEKMTDFEEIKIKIIDPSKRDSIEKQLLSNMKESISLQKLYLDIEKLRREKDLIAKEIDSIKTLITINQTILNQIEN